METPILENGIWKESERNKYLMLCTPAGCALRWEADASTIPGAFSHSVRTAQAQRQLLRRFSREHPLKPTPPTEACMIHSKQHRGCRTQGPGTRACPMPNCPMTLNWLVSGPPPPLCDIPSGCCSFTGPWTVTRSSLRMLRRAAAFCRPLRPVLPLVSFPRSRSPVVGEVGLC